MISCGKQMKIVFAERKKELNIELEKSIKLRERIELLEKRVLELRKEKKLTSQNK